MDGAPSERTYVYISTEVDGSLSSYKLKNTFAVASHNVFDKEVLKWDTWIIEIRVVSNELR